MGCDQARRWRACRWAVGAIVAAISVVSWPDVARAAIPGDGDWQATGQFGPWSEVVYFTVVGEGAQLASTNSLIGDPTDPCSWAGQWGDETIPIGPGGQFVADRSGAGPPATNNHIHTEGRVDASGRAVVTMTVTCVRYRPGLPTPIPYHASETYRFAATLRHPRSGIGVGGALGAHTRVYTQQCVSAPRRLVARAPSRRARRPGRPRVRLRPARQLCSPQRRLRGVAARRAFDLPAASGPPAAPPAPAGCLRTPDAVGLGLTGVLIARRSWCSPVERLNAKVFVVIFGPDGVERREVGSGLVDLERRIELDSRGGGTATIQLGYAGISGEIKEFTDIGVRMRCEFAFGTTCAAVPQGAPQVFVRSGGLAETSYRLEPGAIPGGGRDFMQPWLELRLIPFAGGESDPLAISATARPRCDTEAPGQGCVFPDFEPTMTYSLRTTREIGLHIRKAQASGQPGGRARGGPLTRVSQAAAAKNRSQVCPRSLVRRYRRLRPDGSCDEYPFASTQQGGRGASTANVAAREQNIQGGIISSFYSGQRVLTGDSFWVAVTP